MQSAVAFEHFSSNRAAIARALGITRAAVHKWGALVPPVQARRLHVFTNGKLKYDPADYAGRYSPHVFLPPAVEAA